MQHRIQGTFRITNARLVSPGDPFGLLLYYRMAKFGAGRMPRVGLRVIDEQRVKLIFDWITALPAEKYGQPISQKDTTALETIESSGDRAELNHAIRQLISSTRGAIALRHFTIHAELPAETCQLIIELTKQHKLSKIRDLLERFIPLEQRIKRLGNIVNQAEILNLVDDQERGKEFFFSNASTFCKNCHRIKDAGQSIGPGFKSDCKNIAQSSY